MKLQMLQPKRWHTFKSWNVLTQLPFLSCWAKNEERVRSRNIYLRFFDHYGWSKPQPYGMTDRARLFVLRLEQAPSHIRIKNTPSKIIYSRCLTIITLKYQFCIFCICHKSSLCHISLPDQMKNIHILIIKIQ